MIELLLARSPFNLCRDNLYRDKWGAMRSRSLPSILFAAIDANTHRHMVDPEKIAAIFNTSIVVVYITTTALFYATT